MSTMQLALTSLVAAVPGAALTVLLVLAFINSADTMGESIMLIASAGLALAMGALVTVMPAIILIFVGRKPKAGAAAPAAAATMAEDAESSAAMEAFTSDAEMSTSQSMEIELGESSVIENTGVFDAVESNEFESFETGELESFESSEEIESFDAGEEDFLTEEIEDEPKPKKKKK